MAVHNFYLSESANFQLSTPNSQFAEALWPLLERQALAYTRWESESLPAETVEELYRSLCFCVAEGQKAGAEENPEAQLAAGQRALYRRSQNAKWLLEAVRRSARSFGNRAYRDSLAITEAFLAHYDIRFMAHRVPAGLDYPLACPVPESLPGVLYAQAWLAQLLLENRLLAAFPKGRVHLVLRAASPDPAGLLLNLWEPVFTNALGLALLHENPQGLDISPARRAKLAALCKAHRQNKEKLLEAAERLCTALGLWDEAPRALCRRMAASLAPRLAEAKDLRDVFVTLGTRPSWGGAG